MSARFIKYAANVRTDVQGRSAAPYWDIHCDSGEAPDSYDSNTNVTTAACSNIIADDGPR